MAPAAAFGQWSYKGSFSQEYRAFDGATAPGQVESNLALLLDAQAGYDAGDRWKFSGRLFARKDFLEGDRDALRFDELWVQYATPQWDVRVGNQVHTWGAMETFGITDVLNSRDYQSNIVTPDKIGQPTLRARGLWGNSNLSMYYLPYFIPADYPGQASRYSVGGTVFRRDDAGPEFANQFAARYFYGGSGLDVGVIAFSGLERDALFDADLGTNLITSRSYRSRRVGFDVTKVLGGLLVKTEVVYRDARTPLVDDSLIWAVGFEYTWPSIFRYSDLTAFVEVAGTNQNIQANDFQFSQNNTFVGLTWEAKDRWRQTVDLGWVKNYAKGSGYWALLAEYSLHPMERVKVSLEYQELAGFSVRDPVSNSRSVSVTVGYEF
jgi:hypothetical protein